MRTLGTGAIAALIAGLLLVPSTAAASYPKTRVGGFFEDPAVFLDGEHDLSVETSSEKSSSVGANGVGRNLFYNRFRYYDPSVGRYISPDPIGLFDGANLYHYVANTTGWMDPYGLAESNPTKSKRTPKEFDIAPHGMQPSPRNPLQSHHIIQNEKSNSATKSKAQKKGADWFTQDRIGRALKGKGHWKSKNVSRRTRFLAGVVQEAIKRQGSITGLEIRVKVDKKKKTGNVVCAKGW